MVGAVKIRLAEIKVNNRIRKDFSDIDQLAESIKEVGLIQPLVVDSQSNLIAGERRYRALKKLEQEFVDCVVFETLSTAEMTMMEIDENVQRKDFTWQERVLGIKKVHMLCQVQGIIKGERWSANETARLYNVSKSNVYDAITLAECIEKNDEEVMKCAGPTDALKVLLKRKEQRINQEIAKRNLKPAVNKKVTVGTEGPKNDLTEGSATNELSMDLGVDDFFETEVEQIAAPEKTEEENVLYLSDLITLGDATEVIPEVYQEEYFDAVITDFPYAIQMSNLDLKDIEDTEDEHDVQQNLDDFLPLLEACYGVLKPDTFLVAFCDAMNFRYLHDCGIEVGFSVQRWPLIWYKTSACRNQMAFVNSTKNYEIAIVMRKGKPRLANPVTSSIYMGNNSGPSTYGHAFAKPNELWEWLYKNFVPPFGKVLDPCLGRGSSLASMTPLGYEVHGVEIKEIHYNAVPLNVINQYEKRGIKVKIK